jgi:hypothetical protein
MAGDWRNVLKVTLESAFAPELSAACKSKVCQFAIYCPRAYTQINGAMATFE